MKTSFITTLKQDINSSFVYSEDVIKLASMQLFTSIVGKTPVDTGHLRYNWQLSIDKPKEKEKKGVDVLGLNTIRIAESAVKKYTLKTTQVWITNNVEYAYDIEHKGKSRIKAPAGMVKVSLRSWNTIWRSSTQEINRATGAERRY